MGKVDFKGLKKALSNKAAGSSSAGKMPTYKFPKDTDTVIIRLLPNPNPKGNNFKLTYQHPRLPGMEKKIIKCLTAYGHDCPVCNLLEKYDGRHEDVKNWATRTNIVANVLVIKDKTQNIPSNVPHRVYFGPGFGNFIDKFVEEESEEALATAMFDPEAGRNLIVNRKSYEGAFEFKFKMSEEPIEDFQEIIAGVKDLDETFKDPNDNDIAEVKKAAKALEQIIKDRIQRSIEGTGGEDDDYSDKNAKNRKIDDEEDEIPEDKLAKSKAKTTAKNEPKEQEEDEESSEEEQEEASKAKAKTPEKGAKPAANTKTATSTVKPKETKGKASAAGAPANAPECFGDASVYNGEEDDPCLSCIVSLKCKTAIDQAKA